MHARYQTRQRHGRMKSRPEFEIYISNNGMYCWGLFVKVVGATASEGYLVSHYSAKLCDRLRSLYDVVKRLLEKQVMSVLLIVMPKCTLVALRAAPWRVTVSMPTEETDGLTSDRYVTLASFRLTRALD